MVLLFESHERCDDNLVKTNEQMNERTNTHTHTYTHNCRASIMNSNKHAWLDTCALCLYIFVGHLVMVSLDIFFVDLIP